MFLNFDSARMPTPYLTADYQVVRYKIAKMKPRINAIGGGSEKIIHQLASRQYGV